MTSIGCADHPQWHCCAATALAATAHQTLRPSRPFTSSLPLQTGRRATGEGMRCHSAAPAPAASRPPPAAAQGAQSCDRGQRQGLQVCWYAELERTAWPTHTAAGSGTSCATASEQSCWQCVPGSGGRLTSACSSWRKPQQQEQTAPHSGYKRSPPCPLPRCWHPTCWPGTAASLPCECSPPPGCTVDVLSVQNWRGTQAVPGGSGGGDGGGG